MADFVTTEVPPEFTGVVDPVGSNLAQQIWSGNYEYATTQMPQPLLIADENDCVIADDGQVPAVNIDCARTLALQRENAQLAQQADAAIRDTPLILQTAIAEDRAYEPIEIMSVSRGTEERLKEAILHNEEIQYWMAYPTDSIHLLDKLPAQEAYDSMHGQEKRVWQYLEAQGFTPYLREGDDGAVVISVSLFH